MSLIHPPNCQFETTAALKEYVQSFARTQGYPVVTERSVHERQIRLRCDRGGRYKNMLKLTPFSRRRNTGTRLVSCPFKGYGRKWKDWKWHLVVIKTRSTITSLLQKLARIPSIVGLRKSRS